MELKHVERFAKDFFLEEGGVPPAIIVETTKNTLPVSDPTPGRAGACLGKP